LGQNNQKWKIEAVSGGYYRFINKNSNKALSNDEDNSSADCFQYTYASNTESDWKPECQSDGTLLIRHRYSGRVLDIKNGCSSNSNGARAIIHAYDHTSSQKWRIMEVPCENYAYMVRQNNPNGRFDEKEGTKVEITENNDALVMSVKANNDGKGQTKTAGKIEVYPNPTNTVINLDLSSYKNMDVEIQLVNLMGTMVKTQKVESNSDQFVQMNVEDLSVGTYIIRLKANGLQDQIQRINIVR
jgi:hypothetical protein